MCLILPKEMNPARLVSPLEVRAGWQVVRTNKIERKLNSAVEVKIERGTIIGGIVGKIIGAIIGGIVGRIVSIIIRGIMGRIVGGIIEAILRESSVE